MSCRVIDENDLIPKYLHGQLDPTAQDELELHILECRDCQQAVELLQTVRDEVATRAPEIRSYSIDRGRLWWAWVAVAALILFMSGVELRHYLWRQKSGPAIAQQKPPQQTEVAPVVPAESGANGAVRSAPPVRHGLSEAVSNNLAKQSLPPQGSHNGVTPSAAPSAVPVWAAAPKNPTVPEPEVAGKPPGMGNSPSSADVKGGSLQVATETKGNASGVMSDESEGQLFRLSSVRPAPYDLAGISRHEISPDPAGARPGSVRSSEEGRGLFTSAMRAYVDRNYDEAVVLLQRFLKTEPSAADANFYLGVTLLLQGRPDQAFAPLKTAAGNAHTRWTQPAHFYLAKAYLQTRDLASAETELTAAAAMTGNLTASARADLSTLQALRAKENR